MHILGQTLQSQLSRRTTKEVKTDEVIKKHAKQQERNKKLHSGYKIKL